MIQNKYKNYNNLVPLKKKDPIIYNIYPLYKYIIILSKGTKILEGKVVFYNDSCDHSYHCKKQLSLLINKYFPQVDFRCIFVNKNIVSSFFPFKDLIPLMMSSNIIYKYSCGQCQSSYIGETHRHFISRICEHKGISPRTKKPYVNPPT